MFNFRSLISWKFPHLGKKALFPPFSGFPTCCSRPPEKGEKGRKRAKKADFGRFPGRVARHPLNPHLLHPHLRQPNSWKKRRFTAQGCFAGTRLNRWLVNERPQFGPIRNRSRFLGRGCDEALFSEKRVFQ